MNYIRKSMTKLKIYAMGAISNIPTLLCRVVISILVI